VAPLALRAYFLGPASCNECAGRYIGRIALGVSHMLGVSTAAIATAAAVAVVIIAVAAFAAAARCRLALPGVWVGDGSWLTAAGLESAQLFLAPRAGARRARRGYLVMVGSDGSLVANGAIDVEVTGCTGSLLAAALTARPVTAAVTVRPAGGAKAPPLPAALRASLAPDGTLTIVDAARKTLFAKLYRDPLASTDAITAFGA
jgi:hypothetical protein